MEKPLIFFSPTEGIVLFPDAFDVDLSDLIIDTLKELLSTFLWRTSGKQLL